METNSLIRFAKILAGHYSNQEQAQRHPRYFAHINIYFRPLPWAIFNAPGFYSEQSYDFRPWSPYRQGLHTLRKVDEIFIVENYELHKPERVAGAGFNSELLNDLGPGPFVSRRGCSMHFREVSPAHYKGKVEPGNSCLISREGETTYLTSEVEVNQYKWISLDRGFDPKTHEQRWGSEYGPLQFKRVLNLGKEIESNWLVS